MDPVFFWGWGGSHGVKENSEIHACQGSHGVEENTEIQFYQSPDP